LEGKCDHSLDLVTIEFTLFCHKTRATLADYGLTLARSHAVRRTWSPHLLLVHASGLTVEGVVFLTI
jgi:hypothetical protein